MNTVFKAIALLILPVVLSVNALAAEIETVVQDEIRPSVPFPEFLSTGPYIWYENAQNQPIKGHTFRLATFTVDGVYRVYLEKVNFGDNGCCLEIVDYRELMITREDLAKLFPNNRGQFGFKLISWEGPTSFMFEAFGGRYKLTGIDTARPTITES